MQTICSFVVSSLLLGNVFASLLLKQACMRVCRNAEVSNTFKVDLHALHVDEAIYEVDKTIKALSPFKCKYCQAVCVCVCARVHVCHCMRHYMYWHGY